MFFVALCTQEYRVVWRITPVSAFVNNMMNLKTILLCFLTSTQVALMIVTLMYSLLPVVLTLSHGSLFSLVVHDSGYFRDLHTILTKIYVIGYSVDFPHYLH